MSSSSRAGHITVSDQPEHVPVAEGAEQDWQALEAYLRNALPSVTGPFAVRQFPKGFANLTYLITFGDEPFVLRRPPFGKIAPGAHDMAREFRALSLVSRHFDPAPRPLHHCEDKDVLGAPFIVVEYRTGVGIWDAIPATMTQHPRVGERVGHAVVSALAGLHNLDIEACGLAELGRPHGFVERQLSGWTKRWDLVASVDVPAMQVAAERLSGQLPPASSRHSALHNDFKIDNCQFDPTNPDRVKSIFDWDQATLGDPLVDLGILLNYWPDPTDPPDQPVPYERGLAKIGLPSRADVVEIYREATGASVDHVKWYQAFAAWKTAVVQQQLIVRFQRGETRDGRVERLVPSVRRLASRAVELLDECR